MASLETPFTLHGCRLGRRCGHKSLCEQCSFSCNRSCFSYSFLLLLLKFSHVFNQLVSLILKVHVSRLELTLEYVGKRAIKRCLILKVGVLVDILLIGLVAHHLSKLKLGGRLELTEHCLTH